MTMEQQILEYLSYLREKFDGTQEILHGQNGDLGIVAKVEIIWRSWVWILCSMSAVVGSLITFAVVRIWPHIQ